VSAEVEQRMLEGSEFQTVGAAMLKSREAKVVRTRGTDKKDIANGLHCQINKNRLLTDWLG